MFLSNAEKIDPVAFTKLVHDAIPKGKADGDVMELEVFESDEE
jgi:hypothetical protein